VAIGELARKQHGLVTLGQLQSAGLSPSGVRKRVARGRLHRLHRGVYAVGHSILSGPGRVLAAVLAYGPGAVASHRTAAGLLGLIADGRATIDVSLPRAARSRPGVAAHATATLLADDLTRRHGIPCTGVARTLLDLADAAPRRLVERAVEQAQVLRVFDLRAIEAVLTRADGRRGGVVLRAVLAEAADEPGLTESELEERFLELCRAGGLPRPEVNVWLELDSGPAIRGDFVWREQRLIVETDGWASHGTRRGFEADRLRDQRVRLAGWEPLRFTRRQVVRDPERVTATTAALLYR